MEIAFCISWILGMVLSICFAIVAWISKDKEVWELSFVAFIAAFLTGWITTIPFIIGIGLVELNKRFE
jgi:ABC-type methionine transport system permease subunit